MECFIIAAVAFCCGALFMRFYLRRDLHLAYYDPLTGLVNRMLCIERLKQSMAQAERSGRMVALMFIDLDGFKKVNDTISYRAGNRILKMVATRLKNCVTRKADTVSRWGGDEFTVVAEVGSKEDAKLIAERIITTLSMTYPEVAAGRTVDWLGASVGIALYPTNGTEHTTLYAEAQAAVKVAKENGKGCMWFFDESFMQIPHVPSTTSSHPTMKGA